ncbi:hypothetical protein [Streptococcus sp. 2579]|uniref:hypothetical protein n=1 Tax=Streptococcus sp. 2579 TaxID=2582648 RepID=UPI0015672DAC|nr:hypothetical protein [Streptococcus sp. 2579]
MEQKGAAMITLAKLKEKVKLLDIDAGVLALMPDYGIREKSKEVKVVCKKLERSISEKNWVNCIVLLGEIEKFENYYRNWLIDREGEENSEVLEAMHEYIVELEIGIEERLREGKKKCRGRRVKLVRSKNPSFKDSLRRKFSKNEEI